MSMPLGWTIDDLEEEGPFKKTKIYDEIKQGHLRIRKIGIRTIVTPEDREAWHKSLRKRLRDPEPTTTTKLSDGNHTHP